ncbi:hypothetical protein BH09VER1_BH09VER1_18600 [soil metagenome]
MLNLLNKLLRRSEISTPFTQQADQFEAFIEGALASDFPPLRAMKPCAIVVLPWMETSVPWFAIALAFLYRKSGYPVSIVFHDQPLPSRHEPLYQMEVIKRALKQLGSTFTILKVTQCSAQATDPALVARFQDIAVINADTYLQRVEQGKSHEQIVRDLRHAFQQATDRLTPLFASGTFDHWVLPGGLYGFSSVYRLLGAHYGTRVSFYDSGTGTIVLGTDNVAGHCMDLAKAFSPRFESFIAEHGETMVLLARAELAKRLFASDRYSYQKTAAKAEDFAFGADVLIPLSIFDDAAGIGKTQSFADGAEWLRETVRWLLEETSASVVIREHPSTRKVKTNRSIQLGVAESFKDHPRFRFIAGTDEVSTYALLKRARVVLPCASTVGVEAAALGKHVVMESTAYYSTLDFVCRAPDRAAYFAAISHALHDAPPLSPEQRSHAWICYFMGQVANFIDCDFTPIPEDFAKWVQLSFAELGAAQKNQMVVEVLAENTPSCLVQGRQILDARDFDLPEARDLGLRLDQFFNSN